MAAAKKTPAKPKLSKSSTTKPPTRKTSASAKHTPEQLGRAQLTRALAESARAGRAERLPELLAEASACGLETTALDDALVQACLGRHAECMRVLLAAGANPSARDGYGGALSRLITHGGDVALAQILLDAGAAADSPSVHGKTALHEAIEQGNEALVRLLVARGADVNHAADDEITPLHQAVLQQDPRFVDLLCEAGADANRVKQQSSPLFWAAERASVEHVRKLVAHGASVDRRARFFDQTALHAAFSYGRDDVARVLVQAGADRSLRDERGLSFERIYGPDGGDARTVRLRYAPSPEPQDLSLSIEVAVTNPHAAPTAQIPWLDGHHWAALAEMGAAAESELDPLAGSVEVIEAIDRQGLGRPGFHTLETKLRVGSLSAGFVRWMVLRALGGAQVRAGADAELRVVSIDATGTFDAAPLDLAGLRAWAATSATPGVTPGPLPFELAVGVGRRTDIVIVPEDATTAHEVAMDVLGRALHAWTHLLERVPRLPEATQPFFLMAFPEPRPDGTVRARLMNPAAVQRDKAMRLPWSTASLAAQLGQVLRAAHARVPLRRVELVLGQ